MLVIVALFLPFSSIDLKMWNCFSPSNQALKNDRNEIKANKKKKKKNKSKALTSATDDVMEEENASLLPEKTTTAAGGPKSEGTKNLSTKNEEIQGRIAVRQKGPNSSHAEDFESKPGNNDKQSKNPNKEVKQNTQVGASNQNLRPVEVLKTSSSKVSGKPKTTTFTETKKEKVEDSSSKGIAIKVNDKTTSTATKQTEAEREGSAEESLIDFLARMATNSGSEESKLKVETKQEPQINASRQNPESVQVIENGKLDVRGDNDENKAAKPENLVIERIEPEASNRPVSTEIKPTKTELKVSIEKLPETSPNQALVNSDFPPTDETLDKSDSSKKATSNDMVPHHVVTFTTETPTFNIKAVTDMIQCIKAEDAPVFVISITGVFRSGKSFFINLMKVYLDYYTESNSDVGWENKEDMEISGVNWARGQNAVTHGIWMWMYPSLVHGKAVLFMDCQGTGDNQLSSSTLDNLIVYIGLQLADVQILNIKGQLASTDLDRLSLCALYADSASTGSIFEKLIFLIRDWDDEEPPQQLPEMLEEMTSAITKRSVNGILKAFSDVKAVGLCHPGFGVSRKSEKDRVTIGNVDEEFMETAKKLFRELFGKLPDKTRNTGETLNQQFMMLSARAVDHVSSPIEVLGESLVSRAFEETKEKFMEMLEQEVVVDGSTIRISTEDVTEVYQQAIEMFKGDSRVEEYADSNKQQEYIRNLHYMKGEVVSSVEYQMKLETCDQKLAAQQEVMKRKQEEVDKVKDEYKRLKDETKAGGKQAVTDESEQKKDKLDNLEKKAKEREEEEKDLFWQIDALIQDKHKIIQQEADRHDKQSSFAIRWVLTKFVASRVAKIWERQITKL